MQMGHSAFQIELEFGGVGFYGEGKTRVPGEKPLEAKERTNNKLNPHMASTPGFNEKIPWSKVFLVEKWKTHASQIGWVLFCYYISLLMRKIEESQQNNSERGKKIGNVSWYLYFLSVGVI